MKPLLSFFLVGAIGCFCTGCGQPQLEQKTEQEVQEDLNSQQEMMKAVEPGRGG